MDIDNDGTPEESIENSPTKIKKVNKEKMITTLRVVID